METSFSKSRMVEHDGVRIEKNCCMTYEKKKFCSGGAYISEPYIIAYLSNDGKRITNWDGSEILAYETAILKLSERLTTYGKGYYIRFIYKGKIYSGFCIGEGGIIHARLTKRRTLS
jgi:hypothetical protein